MADKNQLLFLYAFFLKATQLLRAEAKIVPTLKQLSILLCNLLAIYLIQGLILKIRANIKHNKKYYFQTKRYSFRYSEG